MKRTVAEAILGQQIWSILSLDRGILSSILMNKEAFSFSEDGYPQEGMLKYEVVGGTAVVKVFGTILYGCGFYRYASLTDVLLLENTIKKLADDNKVNQVVLVVASGGGSVFGVERCAETIREATKKKPIIAHTSTLMCSAAYWISAACTKVYAERTAEVGSIGVRMRHVEYSKQDEQYGVTITDFGSGEFKTLGSDARPLTDKEKKKYQEDVDKFAEIFFDAIAKYRNLDAKVVKAMEADTYLGEEAVSAGLIDGVKSLDEIIETQAANSNTTSKKKGTPMDKIIKGLKAQFPEVEDSITAIVSQVKGHIEASNGQADKAKDTELAEKRVLIVSLETNVDSLKEALSGMTVILVDSIWDAKLAGSNIPDDVAADVKKMVDASEFTKDGKLDVESYKAAVKAKVDVWGAKFPKKEGSKTTETPVPTSGKTVEGGIAQNLETGDDDKEEGYDVDYIKTLKGKKKP